MSFVNDDHVTLQPDAHGLPGGGVEQGVVWQHHKLKHGGGAGRCGLNQGGGIFVLAHGIT